MNEKQQKSVKSVVEGLQRLQELTVSEGNYAYRGQENADWRVESGAFRRLKETNSSEEDPSEEDFISYHEKELLEPARMDGHGVREGRPLYDLELLAKLQHHGAATCLIDFTRNFLVAMWFACESYKKEEKDGKIFILKTNDEKNFLSLEEKDLEKKVRPILKFQTRDETISSKETTIFSILKPSWWHWSPHGLNQRILKQDSLFIFGQPKIENLPLEEIVISKEEKDKIRKELERLGITERTLFKDLPGFAKSHGYNKSLPSGYGDAKYYLRKGNEALQRNDFESARADYNEAIKRNSEYAAAYFNRGGAKSNLGDLNGAIADYDRVIELKPDYVVGAYFNRGSVKFGLGNYRSAIADYNEAIELNSEYAEAYNARGMVKFLSGDNYGAIADYNEAIELNSEYMEAYNNRGAAKPHSGDNKGAMVDCDRAIELKSDYAEAYDNRGRVKLLLGDNYGAIADYNRAIELKPSFAVAYNDRGIVRSGLDDHRGAIADYNQAIKFKPDFAEAYSNRGSAKSDLDEHSEAIADFNQAIKLKPDNANAYYQRGLSYNSLGDKEKARQDFLKVRKLAVRCGNDLLLGLIDEALSKLDNENNNSS